jgi:glutamyl-tRNA reductase
MTLHLRPAEGAVQMPGPGLHLESATIVAHVLHARHVRSMEREAFAAALAGIDLGPEVILVHTCHRVELYLVGGAANGPVLPPLPPGAERLEDVDAVRHLIEVACGLDSAVFGEDQILHQLRVTLAERREAGRIDPILDRLFQAALRAGRQSHAWFDGSPRSLADVALDVVTRSAGELRDRTVVVVGAGMMGRLAAFAAHRRGARVVVVNRTPERARALAEEVGGTWAPFGVDGRLPAAAGAVVALASTWHVGRDDVERLVATGTPVVDLSSPPSVPSDVQARLGERFISVDDLVVGSEFAPQDRLRRRIEKLVADVGRDFCAWLRARESVPVIQAMASSAEQIRQAELEWLLRRLPELGPDERAVMEQMSHRLVAALLHAPLDALRSDERGTLERAARDLFAL